MITAYDAYGKAIATYTDAGVLIQTFSYSDGTSRTAAAAPTVPTANTATGKFFDGVTFNSVLKSAGELLKVLFPTGVAQSATVPDYTPTYPYLPTNPTTGKNVTGIGWIILVVVVLIFLFSGYNPFKRKK
jgi:hypothetical protein